MTALGLFLPQRAKNEPECRSYHQRRHRLILHGLVHGTLEVTSDFPSPSPYLAHLVGGCTGHTFHAIGHFLELIGGDVLEVRGSIVAAVL